MLKQHSTYPSSEADRHSSSNNHFKGAWATTSTLTRYFTTPPSPSLEQEFSLGCALLCQVVWNHSQASLTQTLSSAWGSPHCLDLEKTDSVFWDSFFTPSSYTLQWGLSPSHPVSDRYNTYSFSCAKTVQSLISTKISMQVNNNLYALCSD